MNCIRRFVLLFLIFIVCSGFSKEHKLGGCQFSEYKNYAKLYGQDIGVAVIAYNRPQYLKQLVSSLERNKEAKFLPFFFFLDGGSNSTQKQNIEIIENSSIINKNIILRDTNYGIVKNHIDSKRVMFDICKFRAVVVLEEDLIVSKYYLTNLINFYNWAVTTYSNIGTVQTWSYCMSTKENKNNNLDLVRQTRPWFSLVTYCMNTDAWKEIKKYLYEFEEKFIDPFLYNSRFDHYRSKPHNKDTINWFSKVMSSNVFESSLCQQEAKLNYLKPKTFNRVHFPNQDVLTTCFLNAAGFVRLQTAVNRVITIGKQGSLKPSSGRQFRVQLHEFEKDRKIKFFKMHK